MGYGFWSNAKDRGTKAFDEKAYEREALPAWDAKWHELSAAARAAFLRVVKGPAKVQTAHSIPPSVASDRFDPGVLKELADAQFVEVQQARSKGSSARVIANPKLFDFATRMRSLERLNLLFGEESGQLLRYVDYSFNQYLLYPVLCDVLSKVGVHGAHSMDGALRNYVMTFRWPGWVAKTLKDPLAERIISLVEKADGPIPLVELPGKLAESDPEKVRATLAKLISHLVLFEDLKPGTWELMVGMLPSVREQLIRASKPRERPPLVVCEHPKKLGPPGSVIVNDLRAFLLEVASEPPRLRRDLLLFATETKRFESPLDPLPAWFLNILSWSQEERVDQATVWARALGMVKDDAKEKPVRLRLTPQGHEWL